METIIPTPVFQGETNECGLACIAMLAETQGISAPLEQLRTRYPASAHGMSLATLCTILDDLAIPTYPVSFEHHELDALPLPAILHYGASHYVVLAYRKGNYVCVINPALGQQLLPIGALKAEISGYALVLDNETPPKPEALKSIQPIKRYSALQSVSLHETAKIDGIYKLMVITFLISLTLFIMPFMVGSAINQVYSPDGAHDFPYVYFLLAFVVSTLLAFGARIITESFIKRFILLKGAAGFSRLLSNSLTFFDKRTPGEIYSRFSNWQLAMGSKIELDNGLRTDWIVGVIALGIMCYMSPLLAMVSGIGVTLMGLVSVWAIYRDRYYTQQLQERSADQSDYLLETIRGFSTIKSAGLVNQRKSGFARYAQALFTIKQKQGVYEQVKTSVYQMIGSLEMVFFMLLALPLLKEGKLSLGAFFAYSFVRQIFTTYITKIFYAILQKNKLHVIDVRAKDLFPDGRVDDDEAAAPKDMAPAARFERSFTYRDISFSYDASQPVLDNLTFTLVRGQHVAIIGESGAGKSTLLKIMAGLMEPGRGEILADDRIISGRQAQPLLFLQSQEDILFRGSVLQNITLFNPYYSDRELTKINGYLEGLNLLAVIEKLPGGVNALISENQVGLSLGQRQRLLLARAMYSERPVLILDEPTANLDEETAHQVLHTLLDHCREHNKTLITVTHNEAVLPMFDRVYQMHKGKIEQAASALKMVNHSLTMATG